MTYIAAIAPESPAMLAHEALTAEFDATFPAWEVSEGFGSRFLSESDFPVYDDSADMDRVSSDDWEAFLGSRY